MHESTSNDESLFDQKSNYLLDESYVNKLDYSTFYPIYRNMISNHKYKIKDQFNTNIIE